MAVTRQNWKLKVKVYEAVTVLCYVHETCYLMIGEHVAQLLLLHSCLPAFPWPAPVVLLLSNSGNQVAMSTAQL
jgi:hypothetical protein